MVDQKSDSPRGMRGKRLQKAVLDATIARIEAVGIDNVRVNDVAQAVGVHETSIYRRWKTLQRLLVDALISRTAAAVPIPDTGSVRSDLETFLRDLSGFVQTPAGTALVRGTVVSGTDAEVEAARREFWRLRLSTAEEIIRRGQGRGEVSSQADPQLAMLLLGGLVHIYATHIGSDLPPALVGQTVDLVLQGIGSES